MSASQSGKNGKRPSNRYHGRVEHSDGRICDWPGCKEAGEFKAPKQAARRSDEPPQWHWFCLEHVREHNESWNYFDALSPEDHASARQAHPSWDGPTFPFRMNPEELASLRMKDMHGIFSSDGRFHRFAESPGHAGRPLSNVQSRALSTLGLTETASVEDIKKRYKVLLKQYHPDANGGDRTGEKKMQAVIAAYHQLMDGQQTSR
ncbi:MAG: J domain-containing protein [Pseudomonadota bacterium]